VWNEATLDKGFDELGYDSLSLVAMVTAFRHDTGVAIAEKLLPDMRTPRATLAILNAHPAAAPAVPKNARNRSQNDTTEVAEAVFHLCPLAPRPELAHVDTEELPNAHLPHPAVGG